MSRKYRGFTLIELLVTLALVSVCASVALPLASVIETRAKEAELRRSLRIIRQAIDNYKTAADAGVIDKETGASGYPASLAALAKGVPRSAAMGFTATPMIFLRSVPKDPFAQDQTESPEKMWNIRAYGSKPGDFSRGKDVFDVSSKSEKTGMNGSPYKDW